MSMRRTSSCQRSWATARFDSYSRLMSRRPARTPRRVARSAARSRSSCGRARIRITGATSICRSCSSRGPSTCKSYFASTNCPRLIAGRTRAPRRDRPFLHVVDRAGRPEHRLDVDHEHCCGDGHVRCRTDARGGAVETLKRAGAFARIHSRPWQLVTANTLSSMWVSWRRRRSRETVPLQTPET